MATDINLIINNLTAFYDFTGKRVISVGCGGGQLLGHYNKMKSILAVDLDEEALEKLKENAEKAGLLNKFSIINNDFMKVVNKADAVLFEFCLHEINDPLLALQHAAELAKDIIIIDHHPSSSWNFWTDEEKQVKISWEAVQKFELDNYIQYNTVQFFNNCEELKTKLKIQNNNALNKTDVFKGKENFYIPMAYYIASIRKN